MVDRDRVSRFQGRPRLGVRVRVEFKIGLGIAEGIDVAIGIGVVGRR